MYSLSLFRAGCLFGSDVHLQLHWSTFSKRVLSLRHFPPITCTKDKTHVTKIGWAGGEASRARALIIGCGHCGDHMEMAATSTRSLLKLGEYSLDSVRHGPHYLCTSFLILFRCTVWKYQGLIQARMTHGDWNTSKSSKQVDTCVYLVIYNKSKVINVLSELSEFGSFVTKYQLQRCQGPRNLWVITTLIRFIKCEYNYGRNYY